MKYDMELIYTAYQIEQFSVNLFQGIHSANYINQIDMIHDDERKEVGSVHFGEQTERTLYWMFQLVLNQ